MKKKASELKQGDKVVITGRKCVIKSIEISEIGKHGSSKCRIEAESESGEKIVIIRPENYPINCE